MRVIELPGGISAAPGFYVVRAGKVVAGPFPSHATAWRWIDRAQLQPISRSEDVADWIASKL
jgi:hypothetical protein